MNVLLLVAAGGVLLFIATRTYPFLVARVFRPDDANPPPSVRLADGKDYVKTPTQVVFAHHFASIAGAGPIVGPIIALAFGWLPAALWIVIGGIFYGAVHDMTAMFVSVREGGKTIAEIARRTLGNFGYLLFVVFLLLVLSLVNAIFLKLSALALTSAYPLEKLALEPGQTLLREVERDGTAFGVIGGIATTSVIIMTLAAPVIGWLVFRRGMRGAGILGLAAVVCVVAVIAGFVFPVVVQPMTLGSLELSARDVWQIVLSIYVFVACGIPVWLVLQPRDFMNVQVLYAGLALLFAGAVVAGFGGASMQLPVESMAEGSASKGPIWPIMFITIACGAISGFHSLVATGTTVKQIPRESDCRRVGYNAMILESFLALLVLVAVGSQMGPTEYAVNMDATAGGGAILTFAVACGQMFSHLGIPTAIGCVLGILIIEGFLVTTLDTAIRLGRYLFEELWSMLWRAARGDQEAPVPRLLRHPIFNTACAVAMMLAFAYSREAYDALWPFFGAGNQLIGALALTTVTLWLLKRGRTIWYTAVPAVFMVITAIWALAWIVRAQWPSPGAGPMQYVIVGAGILLLALSGGFVLVAAARIVRAVRSEQDVPA